MKEGCQKGGELIKLSGRNIVHCIAYILLHFLQLLSLQWFLVSCCIGARCIYKEFLELNISKFNAEMSDEVFLTISCGNTFFIISDADIVFSGW